jgi:hypothetical protein
MFNVGVHNQAAFQAVANFVGVLPAIKKLGMSLYADRHSEQIDRLVVEDKIGDAGVDSLRTLVQGLAVAANASPSLGKALAVPYPRLFCKYAMSCIFIILEPEAPRVEILHKFV